MSKKDQCCRNCEHVHFRHPGWNHGVECRFNPPTASDVSGKGVFPIIEGVDTTRCSQWHPQTDGNPVVEEAWDEFMMVRKLVGKETGCG